MTIGEYLELIRQTRATNNDLWMGILEVALKSSPEETKHLLERIRKNDLFISDHIKKITRNED